MEQTAKALWDTMSESSEARGETNDCTVRALTVVTGLPYDVCHAQLAKQGRKPRKGCHWYIEGPKAAEALGCKMRRMHRSEFTAKTMITAARDRKLATGRYAVLVRGHVAGMIDGDVVDWSDGRRHRIQAVYEVTGQAQAPMAVVHGELPAGPAKWTSFAKYRKADNLELF